VFLCLTTKSFDETQVQERFEVLKKRKDVGSFTEQGKALDWRRVGCYFIEPNNFKVLCIFFSPWP